MNEPSWATVMIEQVMTAEGSKNRPKINWRQRAGLYSSGRTQRRGPLRRVVKRGRYKGYTAWCRRSKYDISITAGTNQQGIAHVLLHELAHFLTPKQRGHTVKFWELAWRLYRTYDHLLDMEHLKKSEFNYMKKAQWVFEQA